MSGERVNGSTIPWLLSEYCRPYLGRFVVGSVGQLVAHLLWLYPTVVLARVIDGLLLERVAFSLPLVPPALVPSTPGRQLLFAIGTMAVTYLLGTASMTVSNWVQSEASYAIQHRIRVETYRTVQALDIGFFDSEESGSILSVLNNDVNQLQTFLSNWLMMTSNSLFIVLGTASYMLVLNWQLALVAFLSPVVVGVVNYGYSRYVAPRYERLRAQVGDVNNIVKSNVDGMPLLKTYTAGDREVERVTDASDEYRTTS